jgi:hypothetical protein
MDEECVKELFSNPITTEGLELCVHQILKKVELVDFGKKIILKYKGVKVGHLLTRVPIEEVKVSKYWQGPFGTKTELSYQGKFVGVLMIEK